MLRLLTTAAMVALAGSMATAGSGGPAGAAPPHAAVGSDEARVEALLSRMSVERKVAQLIMPDISTITPEDVRTYRFGSVLNGGNSGPGGNDKAPAPEWLKLADAFWEASTAPLPGGEPAIPVIWATDAVHGHANIPGATIFPHNIGLGATGDAALMQRIGAATAAEVAVTGMDWTFAPTLAVATDDRWGRTYESFSEDPALVSRLGEAMILGLQGAPGSAGFLNEHKVIATAKHFFGDGGTAGKDRGDLRGELDALKPVHAAPYPPAIEAGVQAVMASFSSINGEKLHGSKSMLTGYLRGGLDFGGLVVGDWNGHGELAQCTNADCPASLLAGLDIYMVPEDWKALYTNLLAQVRDGTIPAARLDEAVGRILLVKQRYGLFDKPRPAARTLAGQWHVLGSAEHRAVAREAVRKSLVLIKNDGVLPIRSSARIVVAGAAADDIAWQAGGWSITWQGGGDLTNADFPGATSIHAGIAATMAAGGGSATLTGGEMAEGERPDAAIVVFGERPYAEFVGDRDDLAFRDEEGLELLRRFKARGIPTVALFLSGRPLWTAREMALADAFVAAWLPGSEGQGVADVLIGDAAGRPRHDFAGQLAFGWPGGCRPDSAIAFPLGFGGRYGSRVVPPTLESECALLNPDLSQGLAIFRRGLAPLLNAAASDERGSAALANLVGRSPSAALTVAAFDIAAQEDGRRIRWSGPASLGFSWRSRPLPDAAALVLRYRLNAPPVGTVALIPACEGCGAPVDLTSSFTLGAGKGWRTLQVPLRCFAGGDLSGLMIRSDAALELEVDMLNIVPESAADGCTGPF